MPPSPSLDALVTVLGIDSMDSPTAPTFPALLQRLYDCRFQGRMTLNFTGGVPRTVELAQPLQVPLDTGKPGPGKSGA